MKKLDGVLVALLLCPAVYAERGADRTLENVIQQFGDSLQYQTSEGDWRVLRNSPEEGFAAGTDNGQGQIFSSTLRARPISTAPPLSGPIAVTLLVPGTTMATTNPSLSTGAART